MIFVGLCVFCSIRCLFFDWWDVPIGGIGFFYLWGVFVRGMCLYGAVFCAFTRRFYFALFCSAVMFCLCGLLFVVLCNVSLAVLLFGCMCVVFWLSCFAVGNRVGLGCDWFGFCGWVGAWGCWECGLGWLFCYG